jgi:Glycosyl hydrolases family 2, sugar binding domain/Glycosyl hydrolases family 2/Glycosyl hydrolases family 2, TIM barrel domain
MSEARKQVPPQQTKSRTPTVWVRTPSSTIFAFLIRKSQRVSKSRHTEAKRIVAPMQLLAGRTAEGVASDCAWKAKYGEMDVSETREAWQFRGENTPRPWNPFAVFANSVIFQDRPCSGLIIRSVAILVCACVLPELAWAQQWKMRPIQTPTRWAASVSPNNALSEYPRPQMVRDHWRSLNGLWQYAITGRSVDAPAAYAGKILVPYPLESALSGVKKPLPSDQLLWYRRVFSQNLRKPGERVLLHFGAVDYQATIYMNGQTVGEHTGGYQNFTFDVTGPLKAGINEIVVKVYDPTENGPNPHGKQGMQYTGSSGIWQTVWLETVPATYIDRIKITPDVDHAALQLSVDLVGNQQGIEVEAIARNGSTIVAKANVIGPIVIPIAHPHLWSPEDPFLYNLDIDLVKDGNRVDHISSYFGMRKIELKKDPSGKERIFLNNRYTFNLGVLDQGFWPDGLYTAPTDAALKFDIQALKSMGFNTIRKHIKVEPERWYYYCDKLGMMVWQDMVNPSNSTPAARAEFENEIKENIAGLYDHPSIVTWVIFNEIFGRPYDQQRLAAWVKQLDPTRLLDGWTGPSEGDRIDSWFRQLPPGKLAQALSRSLWDDPEILEEIQDVGRVELSDWESDMTDLHHYPDPRAPLAKPGKASVLGEFGGIGVFIEDHVWNDIPGSGYVQVTPDQMTKAYADMMEKVESLEAEGLTGSIYTQIVDVESEQNGLMTYDRSVIKIPLGKIGRINSRLVPNAENYGRATMGFSIDDADDTPESQRYAALRKDYQQGKRDLPFLRHLTIMALRAKDQTLATKVGNEYIDCAPRPYSQAVREFIQAVTRTSKDRGFEILRAQISDADSTLSQNSAKAKIRDVIGNEDVKPHISDGTQNLDWAGLEKSVSDKYGLLGREEVYGVAMMSYAQKQDWKNFGNFYERYFATAADRSEYPLNTLSYLVLEHVSDRRVIEAAVAVMREGMGKKVPFLTHGYDNPTYMDTYANLLYKAGKTEEAIESEEEALRLCDGRDDQIAGHLHAMRAGEPTWPAN